MSKEYSDNKKNQALTESPLNQNSYFTQACSITQENPRRYIFNELAPTWDAYSIVTAEKAQAIREFITALALTGSCSVLDVGCGTGVLVPFIAEQLGAHGSYIGIDVSEKMIAEARKKYSDIRFTFVAKDIYEYNQPSQSFDAIILYQAFPHLHEKEKTIAIFKRLLRLGGRLCIAHVSSSCEINTLHKERVRNPILKTDYLPPAEETAKLLSAAGFTVTTAIDQPGRFLVIATV